jgi:hypothetical protein
VRSLPQVAVLIRTPGDFDYVSVVHAGDRRQTIAVVLSQIAATAGMPRPKTMESIVTLKRTVTWVRILVVRLDGIFRAADLA